MNRYENNQRPFRHPPMSKRELEWRGWDQLDVILLTGDAFIDHPSFPIAVIGRVLETLGLKVGFIAQPDWNDIRQFTALGKPRLFFGVSSGQNDSMVANYRPTKRPRKVDFFSPGRLPGLRPDRACLVYSQCCKQAYPDVPVILCGLEATLRKLAHYDFWSDGLARGLLAECEAELLIYGHPERTITQVAKVLARGGKPLDCTQIRGLVYRIPRNIEDGPEKYMPAEYVGLPAWEGLQLSKASFVETCQQEYEHCDYYRQPKALVQEYPDCVLVQTPPQKPVSTKELDRIFSLPYSRTPHPKYREAGPIPSFETVKYAITTHRGCFGGCTFCGQTMYEGRYISQRSRQSILDEATMISGLRYFRGWISNVGGPMANMYGMGCKLNEEKRSQCMRQSCLYPQKCEHLNVNHADYLDLLRDVRCVDGVERCYISSAMRVDILEDDPAADEFLEEIMRHYLPGHLKVSFEHVSTGVNQHLHKYSREEVEAFIRRYNEVSKRIGMEDTYITPYFISAHPGSRMEDAVEIGLFIKEQGLNGCQIQDFVPMPGTASACMYYTGIDPFSEEPVYRPLAYRERKLQRSLFHFYKPQNERYVYDALKEADRLDLVGDSENCLLETEPSWSPFE